MDRETRPPVAVLDSKAPDPGGDRRDLVWPLARRHRPAELDEEVPTRLALAVPRPSAPDGELDLDHRLEPVDGGSLEQADLDDAHGPGRIARRVTAGTDRLAGR